MTGQSEVSLIYLKHMAGRYSERDSCVFEGCGVAVVLPASSMYASDTETLSRKADATDV